MIWYVFIKNFVVGAHYNCLGVAILMSTHNIGFYVEMAKIIFQLSSNIHFICSSVNYGMKQTCRGDKVKSKSQKIKSVAYIPTNVLCKSIFTKGIRTRTVMLDNFLVKPILIVHVYLNKNVFKSTSKI